MQGKKTGRRKSGILLHITSLPSAYGIGDLGPEAYRFADFLAGTKQIFWQILPINPIDLAHGNSPYHSISAFASNPLLISPELMVRDGLLVRSELESVPDLSKGRVDYQSAISFKERLFHFAHERFTKEGNLYEYEKFCSENSSWLGDFALFSAIKSHFQGMVWTDWPHAVRERQPGILEDLKNKLFDKVEFHKFLQYVFFTQWLSLKDYCNGLGIRIFGDIPIYVIHDSVDVWTNPELFELDREKRPSVVAGVPPDYFSDTGQLWGNPIYRWDLLRESGYTWWIRRIERNVRLFDLIRIDHFRGFVGYWAVRKEETNAVNGKWIEAPAEDFFNVLLKKFPKLPIVAEDLGVITPDVNEIMQRFQLPGMKVLLFAFGEDIAVNPYIPHNLPKDCVLYTGTHDNNTVRGWFDREVTPEIKRRVFQYIGREVSSEEIHWELIRLAMMSVADMVIFPMQDILGLGEEARMNRPATTKGNWQWRLLPGQLTPSVADKLRDMTEIYGRTRPAVTN